MCVNPSTHQTSRNQRDRDPNHDSRRHFGEFPFFVCLRGSDPSLGRPILYLRILYPIGAAGLHLLNLRLSHA